MTKDRRGQGRNPTDTDRHVGLRVREARENGDVTQEQLAGHCGITFQQVQKYENGTNRVSCGRLAQIAECLDQAVGWFFEEGV